MTEEEKTNATDVQGTDPAATGTDPVTTEQPTADKTLTQAQVNELLGRTRSEARVRLLKELGVEKFEDAKTALEAAKAAEEERRKAEEAQKSELQKAMDRVAALQQQSAEVEQKYANTVLRANIEREAARLGFNDPGDAYSIIDMAKLTIAEDGAVSGVAEALKELSDSKPYLLRKETPRIPPTNPGKGAAQKETDAERRARLRGIGNMPFGKHGGGVFWPKT